jgi:predicted LPLAT superfamily acyltransferase
MAGTLVQPAGQVKKTRFAGGFPVWRDATAHAKPSPMAKGWQDVGERGAAWGVWLTAYVYRLLGRTVCRVMLAPVVAYFYIAGKAQRDASKEYLERVWRAGYLPRRPGFAMGYRHFLSFAFATLDKLAAWTGNIRLKDVEGVEDGLFHEAKVNGRGAVVISAHLGNPEVIRAIATVNKRFRVNVLMHTLHAERFNRMMQTFSPESPVRMVQVTQIDVGTAMQLSDAISRGEWVVLMGDRIAVNGGEASSVPVDFLGAPAQLPMGPFVLAAALRCPTYTLFCTRKGERFRVKFELLADPVKLPRANRAEAIRDYASAYAGRLEKAIATAPLQWFNFYDYWPEAPAPKSAEVRA